MWHHHALVTLGSGPGHGNGAKSLAKSSQVRGHKKVLQTEFGTVSDGLAQSLSPKLETKPSGIFLKSSN
jgi:hypothetical protein